MSSPFPSDLLLVVRGHLEVKKIPGCDNMSWALSSLHAVSFQPSPFGFVPSPSSFSLLLANFHRIPLSRI